MWEVRGKRTTQVKQSVSKNVVQMNGMLSNSGNSETDGIDFGRLFRPIIETARDNKQRNKGYFSQIPCHRS